jgi:hypothetical protein
MNRSGADAERLGRFEDSCAGREPFPDPLDDDLAHRGTPEVLPLAPRPREASIDAASAITRLSVLNLLLRGFGSGKPLTADQRDSTDLENREGLLNAVLDDRDDRSRPPILTSRFGPSRSGDHLDHSVASNCSALASPSPSQIGVCARQDHLAW